MREAELAKDAKVTPSASPQVVNAAIVSSAADLRKIVEALNDLKKGYLRVQKYYKYVAGTLGDVTVGLGGGNSAIRFPEAGSTRSVRDFIRSGEVTMVRVHNTGTANPAYVGFNMDVCADSALVVPAGAIHEFELKQFDFVSICSTAAATTTTVRVSFWGE